MQRPFYHSSWSFLVSATASVLSQLLTFSGQNCYIRSITAPDVFWTVLLHPFYHSSWRFLVSATASVLSQLLAFSGQNCCIQSVTAPGVFWSLLLHPFYHSFWRFLFHTVAFRLSIELCCVCRTMNQLVSCLCVLVTCISTWCRVTVNVWFILRWLCGCRDVKNPRNN